MPTSSETDLYYNRALNPIFLALSAPAFITVARWSYVFPEPSNLLVFTPGPVGGLKDPQAANIQQAFDAEEFKRALSGFSFTKLLVENDQEIWFHFTNENPPESGERQVYLSKPSTSAKKEVPVIEVAAEGVTLALVRQIIKQLEDRNQKKPLSYGGDPLSDKQSAIMTTLNAVIFSLFQKESCGLRHAYFMPVVLPSAARRVSGIISINSPDVLKVSQIEPVLQPFAQGIMSTFHLREIEERRKEIEERRKMFSLRSAIAAIMSRNMSHNIGSHVLWHLSQDLNELRTGQHKG